jgi:hypothetical protein
MPSSRTRSQGKTSFVKEHLIDNPYANSRAVNEAWKSAGMDGTISDTLVNKMKSHLGLTGNLRGKRRANEEAATGEKPAYTGKKRGRKPKIATIATTDAGSDGTRTRTTSQTRQLAELEVDLDRLLFKVMNLGGLAEIENALRETRRMLYGGFSSKHS